MKLAIFTDVHANLPALAATLTAIDKLVMMLPFGN